MLAHHPREFLPHDDIEEQGADVLRVSAKCPDSPFSVLRPDDHVFSPSEGLAHPMTHLIVIPSHEQGLHTFVRERTLIVSSISEWLKEELGGSHAGVMEHMKRSASRGEGEAGEGAAHIG